MGFYDDISSNIDGLFQKEQIMQNEANNEVKEVRSEVRVPFVNHDDPTLLLVRGNIDDNEERKRYIKALADAVLAVFHKHKKANLRCVGAAAINNAEKAVINASAEVAKAGINLATTSSFQTVTFNGTEEKTAILKTVRRVEFVD